MHRSIITRRLETPVNPHGAIIHLMWCRTTRLHDIFPGQKHVILVPRKMHTSGDTACQGVLLKFCLFQLLLRPSAACSVKDFRPTMEKDGLTSDVQNRKTRTVAENVTVASRIPDPVPRLPSSNPCGCGLVVTARLVGELQCRMPISKVGGN